MIALLGSVGQRSGGRILHLGAASTVKARNGGHMAAAPASEDPVPRVARSITPRLVADGHRNAHGLLDMAGAIPRGCGERVGPICHATRIPREREFRQRVGGDLRSDVLTVHRELDANESPIIDGRRRQIHRAGQRRAPDDPWREQGDDRRCDVG